MRKILNLHELVGDGTFGQRTFTGWNFIWTKRLNPLHNKLYSINSDATNDIINCDDNSSTNNTQARPRKKTYRDNNQDNLRISSVRRIPNFFKTIRTYKKFVKINEEVHITRSSRIADNINHQPFKIKVFLIMRKIRLALVSLDWIRPKDPLTNLGHASILATLQKYNSHQLTFLNNHRYSVKHCPNVEEFSENVIKNLVHDEPDLIAFGVYIWNELHTQLILKKLRKRIKDRDCLSVGFAGKGRREGRIMIDYFRKPLILLGGPQVRNKMK
ncbi:hypothetical protein RclHR1_03300018 [Rhizophagus clarus]|uniref:B12-binding domain-containing protein n=1 Tax=Rhizophagus clarus TaxID=94130 RepID=A0A2Z6S3T6_9GLOM|nr:hypothetical protein RclHR1_03300018 [Rhizophagus clarus]